MNASQHRMYWAEWRKAWEQMRGRGFSADEEEAQRHRIHFETLGADVSSRKLTNAQLDAVLAAFRAHSRPDDLHEQLRLIDQPEKRLAAFRDRATKLATALCDERGPAAYLEYMARQVCKRPWAELRETEVATICGILTKHAKRVRASVVSNQGASGRVQPAPTG